MGNDTGKVDSVCYSLDITIISVLCAKTI